MIAREEQVYREERRDYDLSVKKQLNRPIRKKSSMSSKDKGRLLKLIFAVGFVCIGIVVSVAYCASVNYTNNLLRDENIALQGEVDSLGIQIQSANNIASIEAKAIETLGMVYPEGESFVVVSNVASPEDDLAGLLKAEAYQ